MGELCFEIEHFPGELPFYVFLYRRFTNGQTANLSYENAESHIPNARIVLKPICSIKGLSFGSKSVEYQPD